MTANVDTSGTIANVGMSGAYVHVAGVSVGYLKNPAAVYRAAMEFTEKRFGNYAGSLGNMVSSESATFDVIFAEESQTNLNYYLGGMGTIASSKLSFGGKKGSDLPTYEVKIYFLHPDGHPLSGKMLTIYKAELHPNGDISHDTSTNEFEGIPVQIVGLEDSTRTAGDRIFAWDAVDTTVPTISESSPADGGVSASKTADYTITFDMAMGVASATEDTVILAKTDLTSFVDLTSMSFNTARTILTVVHPALTGAIGYSFILSGLKSSGGVSLARTTIDFTTAA